MVSKLIEVWVDCFCYFLASEFCVWRDEDRQSEMRGSRVAEQVCQNGRDFGWKGNGNSRSPSGMTTRKAKTKQQPQQQIPFGDDNKKGKD
jgi:hypothetical protein